MKPISRFAPWINRLVLAAATFHFTMIGARYIANPVGVSAGMGVSLNSSLAITTTRVGFGAFPLSFAIFSFLCLLSPRRLRTGVSLVAVVIATAIVVRLVGTAADGAVTESIRLFIPEGVILVLSAAGLLLGVPQPQHHSGGVA
jgi:hypothetical protein